MKDIIVDELCENIIIGGILGDGNLALYGRSKNAYYREHGGVNQLNYRIWKCQMLEDIGFKIRFNEEYPTLTSKSMPYFTDLYYKFYVNKVKVITEENIKLLTHPIGLAVLFMDDGSLVIDSSYKSNKKYIFPRISIYTQSFSMEENLLIIKHIKNKFDIEFKLHSTPYGKKYNLEINKRNEIFKFINVIKPYVEVIPDMTYKINIKENMDEKYTELVKKGFENVVYSKLKLDSSFYTLEDEKLIREMISTGISQAEIARNLNKTYYGIVDKIRRMRIENKL